MPSPKHIELVALGARWLKRQGFGVVATELVAGSCSEQPDVIGFRSACSAIIEAKVSRSDFLADFKKPARSNGGLGTYRFYLCPDSLIAPDDLPKGWGLLHEVNGRIKEVVRPKGNVWPGPSQHRIQYWTEFQHEVDQRAERRVLYSIARRLAK